MRISIATNNMKKQSVKHLKARSILILNYNKRLVDNHLRQRKTEVKGHIFRSLSDDKVPMPKHIMRKRERERERRGGGMKK